MQIVYRGIEFDDFTEDKDYYNEPFYWSQVCLSHAEQIEQAGGKMDLEDFPEDCDDDATEDDMMTCICGVKGCNNRAYTYMDMQDESQIVYNR